MNPLAVHGMLVCRVHGKDHAKSKGGWVGLEALACIGWVDVTALGSIVGHQPLQRHVTAASLAGEHACETAEPQQDSGPTGCHLVGRAGAVWHLRNPLKAKVDVWGWKLWQALVGLT